MPTRPSLVSLTFPLCLLCACGPGRGAASSSEDTQSSEASGLDTESTSTNTETETGPSEDACQLAIRIDLCCNQPFPTTPDEIATQPCVVDWPIDWDALPEALVAECTTAQPDWCGLVDCNYAEPASEVVAPNEAGECEYVCPEELYLAYRSPGCGEPPPIAECLGVPPPCADEYCSCDGETIYGCGQVGEPYEHLGACE
jgi:hypothetical protein